MPQAAGTNPSLGRSLRCLCGACRGSCCQQTNSLKSSLSISTGSWASRAGFCPQTKSSGCRANKNHASPRSFSKQLHSFPFAKPLENGRDPAQETPNEGLLTRLHQAELMVPTACPAGETASPRSQQAPPKHLTAGQAQSTPDPPFPVPGRYGWDEQVRFPARPSRNWPCERVDTRPRRGEAEAERCVGVEVQGIPALGADRMLENL